MFKILFFFALVAFAFAAPKAAPQFISGLYGGYTGLGYSGLTYGSGYGYASPYAYGGYGGYYF